MIVVTYELQDFLEHIVLAKERGGSLFMGGVFFHLTSELIGENTAEVLAVCGAKITTPTECFMLALEQECGEILLSGDEEDEDEEGPKPLSEKTAEQAQGVRSSLRDFCETESIHIYCGILREQ